MGGMLAEYLKAPALRDTRNSDRNYPDSVRTRHLDGKQVGVRSRICIGDEIKSGSLPGPAKRYPNTVVMGCPTARQKRPPLTTPGGD